MKFRRVSAVLAGLWLLAGCAGAPPPLPAAQRAAAEADTRGRDAFRHGDYQGALADYQQTLALNRSSEDINGIATSLLNLSLVYRRLGDDAKAMEALDQILSGDGLAFTSAQKTEAAYRKANYYLEDGDTAEARNWTAKALGYCNNQCPAEGRLYNLMARMALPGNPAEAQKHAQRALPLNRAAGDKVEEANSLRLLADSFLMANDLKYAQQFYEDALQIDKDGGAPAKFALDLMGLGRCLARQGQRAEAVVFFQRAYSVAEGAGDTQIMNDAVGEMNRLRP
jgi:tetratricopeptide (TPR) repeat protein